MNKGREEGGRRDGCKEMKVMEALFSKRKVQLTKENHVRAYR